MEQLSRWEYRLRVVNLAQRAGWDAKHYAVSGRMHRSCRRASRHSPDWKICICGFSRRKWRAQNELISFGIETWRKTRMTAAILLAIAGAGVVMAYLPVTFIGWTELDASGNEADYTG